MKLVLTLALVLSVAYSDNSFSFLLNPEQVRNVTLEFRTSYRAYQLQVKCDYSYYNYWQSTEYGFVQVTPEQRQSYKCSDSNFTVTVSNDFNLEDIIVYVLDYNTYTQIAQFSFISDRNQPSVNELTSDKAAIYNFYYTDKNDYKASVTIPSTVYVEIFSCPQNQYSLQGIVYDINKQYRNLTSVGQNRFYDVFNTSNGDFTYRIASAHRYYPDVFIKYQRTYQQSLNNINTYARTTYYVSAEVRQSRVFVSIPTIYTLNYESVEFHISITSDNYVSSNYLCSFGDTSLEQQYDSNYYTFSLVAAQRSRYSDTQQEVLNFPNTWQGYYTVNVVAIIDHGAIKQTIPYVQTQVYQDYYHLSENVLIYCLMPVFVSVLALLGMGFGGLKYRSKKKEMEKLEQQQLLEKAGQQAINRNYFGVQ